MGHCPEIHPTTTSDLESSWAPSKKNARTEASTSFRNTAAGSPSWSTSTALGGSQRPQSTDDKGTVSTIASGWGTTGKTSASTSSGGKSQPEGTGGWGGLAVEGNSKESGDGWGASPSNPGAGWGDWEPNDNEPESSSKGGWGTGFSNTGSGWEDWGPSGKSSGWGEISDSSWHPTDKVASDLDTKDKGRGKEAGSAVPRHPRVKPLPLPLPRVPEQTKDRSRVATPLSTTVQTTERSDKKIPLSLPLPSRITPSSTEIPPSSKETIKSNLHILTQSIVAAESIPSSTTDSSRYFVNSLDPESLYSNILK
ncbi:hypothetical protein H0H81_003728 [Sphagnurus paluster]|uniref:Uncharacterized protein n=1 Tax=Sphagnurus paluster TaxID=117069 RepID=A0A9P7K7C6_9AGAR|nr:hypothetical protein H0H81_003728 [Sphagnurus paluster]